MRKRQFLLITVSLFVLLLFKPAEANAGPFNFLAKIGVLLNDILPTALLSDQQKEQTAQKKSEFYAEQIKACEGYPDKTSQDTCKGPLIRQAVADKSFWKKTLDGVYGVGTSLYGMAAGFTTLPLDLIGVVAPSLWSELLKIGETTKDVYDAVKTLLPTKSSTEKQNSNFPANIGSAMQPLLPDAPKTTGGAMPSQNWQEQLRQAEEAKKKQAEEEKKRIEAEQQKQEDQRKIEELHRAQTIAEENLKKAKTADEQRIAEEARKKAEQAKIAAEQEAQKHQQEESLRRAQEEQRQTDEQRKAQAAAEEAKRREQQANTVVLPLPSPNPTPVPNPIPTTPPTQIPPTPSIYSTPKSNFITLTKSKVVDQFGIPFEHILITCEREDGNSCNIQSDFGNYIKFGPQSERDKPFLDGKYKFTIQGGLQGTLASNAAVKTVTIAHADGSVIDIGEVILKRWGKFSAIFVDKQNEPLQWNLYEPFYTPMLKWFIEGITTDTAADLMPIWSGAPINQGNRFSISADLIGNVNYIRADDPSSAIFSIDVNLPDGRYLMRAFHECKLYDDSFGIFCGINEFFTKINQEKIYETNFEVSNGTVINLKIIDPFCSRPRCY